MAREARVLTILRCIWRVRTDTLKTSLSVVHDANSEPRVISVVIDVEQILPSLLANPMTFEGNQCIGLSLVK